VIDQDLLCPSASTGTVLLTNVLSRTRRSLDGTWRAIIDPYDWGYVDILNNRNSRGFQRDFTPRSPSDRVEYDFDTSMELAVPGDWNTQDPSLLYYEGTVWYRTIFNVDADEDGRTFLNFGAACHTTRVFLDGRELCTHVGGYGQFATEVTGLVGPGEHSLVVQVNNRREATRIPAMRSDWWNFGGITRSVDLISVPDTFLRDAWLTMGPDGRLIGGATVDGPGAAESPSLTVELVDQNISVAMDPVDEGPVDDETAPVRYTVGFEADVERWAPGRPVLHKVRWRCGADEIIDDVGFRTITTEGNRIFVNGEETFLKGIAIHGEGPSGGRRAHGPADAETLLEWAADLGANFVRLGHYQHDEHMVREADRRGLLAWVELPVYWAIAYENEDVLANALAQADELVVRDRSRVSIGLWSVANETLPGDGRIEFLTSLVDRVRSLDHSRLTTAALITLPTGELEFDVDDPLGEAIDVVAINQYLGWYYGDREDIPNARFSTPYGKPIIFSELGAGAKFGKHGDEDEIWTEEFQAAVYRAQLDMVSKQPDCVGLSPWILKDFRTPVRVLPGIQDGYNRKGLVSEEGERKLAFDVVREVYDSLD
jgi:beta-glucuronidase